jgi:hypothetical protein
MVSQDMGRDVMRRGRLSISWVMFVVSLIAVDCALLRSPGGRDDLSTIRFTSLVFMGDFLAISLFRLITRRGEDHPFLVGFGLAGLVGILLLVVLPRLVSGAVLAIHDRLLVFFWHPVSDFDPGDPYGRFFTYMILIFIPAVLLTLPLLTLALIGGYLYRRIARYQDLARQPPR